MFAYYTYDIYGNKDMSITVKNRLSEFSKNFTIEVQDEIKGIELPQNKTFDTVFGNTSKFYGSIKEGTAMICWFDFIINSTYIAAASPKVFPLDTLSKVYIFYETILNSTSFYTVNLTCKNDISSLTVSSRFWVERSIENLKVRIEQQFSGTPKLDYIEVNETLMVIVEKSQGDNVVYYYYFDDDPEIPPLNSTNSTTNTSFPSFSENWIPKNITVIAKNHVSEMTATVLFIVHKPVQPLEGFFVFTDPISTTDPTTLHIVKKRGDFYNCTWEMDNIRMYTDFLQLERSGDKVGHLFSREGKHNLSLFCANRLYEISVNLTLDSYRPCGEFSVEALSACPEKPLTAGFGDRENMYPYQCPVLFRVADQVGTNASNYFDFGYTHLDGTRVTEINYPISNVTHFYDRSIVTAGDSLYDDPLTVTIVCKNKVTPNGLRNTREIILVTAIDNFTISTGVNPKHMLGYTSNFSITLSNNPYKPCCTLYLDNPSEEHKTGEKFLFGNKDCIMKKEYADGYSFLHRDAYGKPLVLEKDKEVAVLHHKYKYEGLYNTKISCANELTKLTYYAKIKVLDLPCERPNVTWESAVGETPAKAVVYKRCMKVTVAANVFPFCQKVGNTLHRIWKLEKILDSNGEPVSDEEEDLSCK